MVPRRKILLVEDSADDAFLFAQKIEALGRFDILVLNDGYKARRHLEEAQKSHGGCPAAIFLDLRLPLVGGMDLLQWIREQPEYAETPCYVVSGDLSPVERLQSRNRGARAAFTKPVNATTLAYVLSEV